MSTYKVVDVIGTSPTSWEDAVQSAIRDAAQSLRHLRVAEVSTLDVTLADDGTIQEYRAKVHLSIKHDK
jgi:hypothetical protein